MCLGFLHAAPEARQGAGGKTYICPTAPRAKGMGANETGEDYIKEKMVHRPFPYFLNTLSILDTKYIIFVLLSIAKPLPIALPPIVSIEIIAVVKMLANKALT